jgi:hypothetical protein
MALLRLRRGNTTAHRPQSSVPLTGDVVNWQPAWKEPHRPPGISRRAGRFSEQVWGELPERGQAPGGLQAARSFVDPSMAASVIQYEWSPLIRAKKTVGSFRGAPNKER